jgi:hypothetical protein
VTAASDLLHDASFPLRESDMTTRFVLDEFDLNLSPLTATLFIIVVVVVACCRHSRTLCASRLEPIAGEVVARGRVVEGARIGDVGHVDDGSIFYECMDRIGRSTKSRLGCRNFDERGNSTVWVWC